MQRREAHHLFAIVSELIERALIDIRVAQKRGIENRHAIERRVEGFLEAFQVGLRAGDFGEMLALEFEFEMRQFALFLELFIAQFARGGKFDLLAFRPQIDKNRDFGTQNIRVERLGNVIDGAGRIALENVVLLFGNRGHENNRDVPGFLALFDERRGFETIETGHLNIHQNKRELFFEQIFQRLRARSRLDETAVERFENRAQRQQIFAAVIDQQNVGLHQFPASLFELLSAAPLSALLPLLLSALR